MSGLLDVLLKLSDTQEAIRRTEALLLEAPGDKTILAMLESLGKRASKLEDSFLAVADSVGLDVCAYRLFSEGNARYSIHSLGSILQSFQMWFSTVYDALKNGPKLKAKISPEVLQESALDFAFSFTGSLGVALTIPSERQLFENDLQRAMVKTVDMLRAEATDQINKYAEELGGAVIHSFHNWVDSHVKSGAGADIRWLRGQTEVATIRAGIARFQRLESFIQTTTAPVEETFEVKGLLVGADTKKHSFHMVFENAEEIRGTMSEAIGEEHTVELPQEYIAIIRRTTSENLATGKKSHMYHLLRLRRV